MKKKFMLASALFLAVGIGTVQPVLAQKEGEPTSEGNRLFLGCGTVGYDSPCVAGFTTHFEQLYIFGIAVGDAQMGGTTGC